MNEHEKNSFLQSWHSMPQVSIPLSEKITSSYRLVSVLKDNDQECTCLLCAKENEQFYILKCSFGSSHNTARHEYEMLCRLSETEVPSGIFLPSFMDYFEEQGTSYLIRSYLHGSSFHEYVSRTSSDSLPEDTLIDCALQLCEALDFLHAQTPPIIHRDIKPDNIIIDPDGRFHLIDFGIARFYKKERHCDTENMGSEHFAAPEQFGYAQSDARTDIYSLGALLLYGATCEYDLKKLDCINLSSSFKHIIRRCMQFAPKDRYQSISSLRRDLKRVQHMHMQHLKGLLLIGGILLAGAAAILAFFRF